MANIPCILYLTLETPILNLIQRETMTQANQQKAPQPSLRNLHILEIMAQAARPMTPTEMNAELDLPKPTIHRLVGNLETEGYLSRHLDGRSYLPGPKLRQMMLGVMRAGQHHTARNALLTKLHDEIGETCNLSVPDGDAMVYVDRIETHWPLRITLSMGSRVPLHATSAGKMALAHMSEDRLEAFLTAGAFKAYTQHTLVDADALRKEMDVIRLHEYAMDSEEFMYGLIAVAVPVRDPQGRFCATLSFHAPIQRLSLGDGLTHLPLMRSIAEKLGKLI